MFNTVWNAIYCKSDKKNEDLMTKIFDESFKDDLGLWCKREVEEYEKEVNCYPIVKEFYVLVLWKAFGSPTAKGRYCFDHFMKTVINEDNGSMIGNADLNDMKGKNFSELDEENDAFTNYGDIINSEWDTSKISLTQSLEK